MAKQASYLDQLTAEQMNGGEPYRVKLSYGTFSISARNVTQSGGVYYSAYKRHKGRLFKQYVGKAGGVAIYTRGKD